jgi:arsenate reductase
MADGFANKYLKDFFISSAGTHPEGVNQNAINAMKKIGIDISNNQSNKIDFNQLNNFDYIITLCGDARDNCLNLSEYKDKHIHWDIEDPAKFDNFSNEEIDLKYSKVRDNILNKILLFKKNLLK